ncbi:ATM interactor-like [Panonychus citri]|uniref:ATM interactor-like n=1 Tax=Panonychus citri TaxID=50023 RepID=UPI0023079B55|nr:ATM interactor-like [Panonychus citri]
MSEKKYHCPVEGCSFQSKGKHFKRKMSIDQHFLNCHSERKYKCFNCDKSYAIDWQLKYHLKTCGLIWKCLTCDKFYKERLSLITHCTRHSHVLPDEARRRKTKSKKEDKSSSSTNNSHSGGSSKDTQVMILPVMMPTAQTTGNNSSHNNQTSSSSSSRHHHQSTTSSSSSSSSSSSRHHHHHHHQSPHQAPKQLQQPNPNRAHHHHPPQHLPKPPFQNPIAPPTVDYHQLNQRINIAELYANLPQMMDPNSGYMRDTSGQSDVEHLKHGLHHFAPPRAHLWSTSDC